MESLSLHWIADALDINPPQEEMTVTAVCTDTRQLVPGALFVALRGETFDGHAFVAQAFAAGAVAALVETEVPNVTGVQLVVPDTLKAYGDLAHAYRMRFPKLSLVAVTGSVGKTSTKEMIAAVLRTRYKTLATEKNYNNEIGVPRTLFELTHEHEAAVIEMGMRGLGEIARLAEIAEPNIALITNIGYAHIERLGSRENIALAKTELFAALKPGATAIFSMEDEFTEKMRARIGEGVRALGVGRWAFEPETLPYAKPQSREEIARDFNAQRPTPNARTPRLPIGSHHRANAEFALAVAELLAISREDAVRALENWTGAEGRMTVRRIGELTVLDDCYNAGVESMKAALETLRQMKTGGIAVLGDMKELGEYAQELHQEVGRAAAKSELRLLVTVGELAKIIAEAAPNVPHLHAESSEGAFAVFANELKPDDVVLVKGSRAMQMERIISDITFNLNSKLAKESA